MLVGHHVVLVLRVDGLVLGLHEYLVAGQLVAAEVLEEVGVAGAVEVDVGVGGVFVLVGRGWGAVSLVGAWPPGGKNER